MNNQIILIGGAPTVGKSTTAKRLAKHLDIPWISTDVLCRLMQKIVSPKDFPHMTTNPNISAEEWLRARTPQEIVEQQNRESEEVWKGIVSLIESDGDNWSSFIIEGIAILPHLIQQSFKNNPSVKPLFLFSNDKERIKEVIYKRGVWASAHTYSDEVKPIEVEWTTLFNEWIQTEAKKYGYPTYEVKEKDFKIEDLVELISYSLSRRQ